MGAATPHCLLAGLLLTGAFLGPKAARAEEPELPPDRQGLEEPSDKSSESLGFDLPPSPDDSRAPTDPAVDPMGGWQSADPRIERRERRLIMAGSAYGFAGAFAGLSVWTLITSTSYASEKGRRDWRTASLVLAGLSGVGLTIGTIAWATAPRAPGPPEGAGITLGVGFAPGGLSARLQLRFF